MKRDWDLVLQLLGDIENASSNRSIRLDFDGYPDHDRDTVLEHLEMLIDDVGLVDGKVVRSGMGGERVTTVFTERLRWDAHEFLADARTQGVWKKVKEKFPGTAISASWDILRPLVAELARKKVSGEL